MGCPIFPVAREKGTGQVVGFAMLVPIRFSRSGEEHKAVTGFNLLVDPAYRGRGVFTTIVEMAVQEAIDGFQTV